MKNVFFTVLLVISLSSINVFSQENFRNFQNKEYVKINNEWKVLNVADLQHYSIQSNVVTIKFKQNATTQEIQNYVAQNNLTLLRKAITGWYDFQINESIDIFQKSTQLIGTSTTIVDKFEIPTNGSYNIIPNDTNQVSQWYLTKINAYGAWNIETGKPNVKVAILDSGSEWEHEDIGSGTDGYQNIYINNGEDAWTNINNPSTGNGIDDDGNGLIDDWKGWNFDLNNNNSRGTNWHGTLVAGIVGAKTNNNKGVAGISGGWNSQGSKLLICNVGQNVPNGSVIDDAILYAGQMGVKVVQLSLSVAQSAAINDAIDFAYDNYGVIIVCASGNNAPINIISYPASHPKVISVGATTQNDEKASFSKYGQNLFISAPGVDIYNTLRENPPLFSSVLLGSYGSSSGTSFAAPIVSGLIALLYSINPCLTQAQVKQILRDTSEKVGNYNYNWNTSNIGHSKELGYGRVNAFLAVQMAQFVYNPNLDLMVRDGVDDFGIQPNTTTQASWNSPDIWVRNQNDGIQVQEHQNPKYYTNGNSNYIYVRITNKSCTNSFGTEELKIYLAQDLFQTSFIWPTSWNPTVPIGQITIPTINSGNDTIVTIPWIVPDPTSFPNNPFSVDGSNTFSLLTRIVSNDDPMAFPETGMLNGVSNNPKIRFFNNVKNNNNIAYKNINKINLANGVRSGLITIENLSNEVQNSYLELVKESSEMGNPIFEEAEIILKMDDILYNAWDRGGKLSQKLDATTDVKNKLVEGNNVILDNISLNPNEKGTLKIDFNFLTERLSEKNSYLYHIIQKNKETGEIMGGSTFEITKEMRPVFSADAGETKIVNKNELITINASQISEPAIYNWYDIDGNLIFTGKDLTIATEVATKYKLEVIATADGFKDYSEVEVNLKPSILNLISPNPASENVNISYKLNGVGSAYLMIIGGYGITGTSNNYILNLKC